MTLRRTAPVALALLLAWTAGAAAQSPAPDNTPALVILVRHAEKASSPADDPPLTKAGLSRARALGAALGDARVGTVITTQWARTKQTAAPIVASPSHPRTEIVPTIDGDTPAHARNVAAAILKHPGEAVLVVGHSNTVPAIIAALGGPSLPNICDSVFDELFVLVPDGKGFHLVRGRYGASSSRKRCK